MDLREQLRRRSRDSRWIVVSLLALLVVISAIFYLLQRRAGLPDDLARNRILVFVLVYINVVLILVILFVLLRNLFKLLVERQNRILGSKFKIKLVGTYIGLSLLPVLLLFLYGTQLLQGWIDRWFDEPAIQQVLEQGYAVSQALNHQIEDRHLLAARRIGREIRSFDLDNPRQKPALAKRMNSLLLEWGLDSLALFRGTEFVNGLVRPESGLRDLPEADRRFLLEALNRHQSVRFLDLPGIEGRLVLTATATGDGELLILTGSLLDPLLARQTEQLIQAHQGYLQLEVQKEDIEASYQLMFLMVTLMILLAFSWVGLTLARRVTVPIQALAEGTRRISGGDLDHRVQVEADDELGVLVDSFNRMTAELKRNKEELVAVNLRVQEERGLMAAVLENMAAGVIFTDGDDRILVCNRAALTMLRQRESEVVGRTAADAWGSDQRHRLASFLTAPLDPGRRLTRQVQMVLGGELKTFEAKMKMLADRQGAPAGRVAVLEDLTELIKAQHLAAWNEAARRIAHEIKNPLTPIKLSAERLARRAGQGEGAAPEAIREAVEIIVREVEGMRRMVDEFSRFARMPGPKPREVELARLIDETLHLYEGIKPGVEVTSALEEGLETAVLDGEQIKRALINLLDNAIQATAAPGEVAVDVCRDAGRLRIAVADTGPGIPEAAREKLFLPHFSTKGRGTGLGLAIVHRIVTDHHGTIRVENNEPRGTIFVLELPLH